MISFVNIKYIILIGTFHYFITCTFQLTLGQQVEPKQNISRPFRQSDNERGCTIPMPKLTRPRRPIPASLSKSQYDSIEGHKFHAKPQEFLQYACDSGKILAVKKKRIAPKIIVKCEEDKLDFRGEKYNYEDFSCEAYLRDVDVKVNSSSKSHLTHEIGPYDCFLPVHGIDYYMPIPFTASTTNPMIIHPDSNGNLIIKQNTEFRLACTGQGNEFMSPGPRNRNELLVKCLNGSFIEYRRKIYTILDFWCSEVPKATLELTDKTCYNNSYNVYDVGFQTNFSFLRLYRICYDMVHKNAKYSWYYANTPVWKERQMAKSKMVYGDTLTFGDIQPRKLYRYQWETIKDTIKSPSLANYIIRRDQGLFLAPGHLLSKKEFVYVFEQHATYFYENTIPQWYIYIKKVWRLLQNLINVNLSHDYTRHLIISGTYNITHLPDNRSPSHPIFLSPPESMAVPLYVWKMDYDLDRKNGTVYIGLNNPYKHINSEAYICNAMPCPSRGLARKAFELNLLYCCSKKDFEEVYGPLDPIVYEDF